MSLEHWLEIIKTIATVIGAGGIAIAALQFRMQREIWQTQHERARREKAIEIVRTFITSFDAASRATNIIVERLSSEQLSALDLGKPFDIDSTLASHLQAALAGDSLLKSQDVVQLSAEQSYRLRYQALNFLNSVEMVCQAWLLDVGHKKLIESEIKFLYNPLPPDRTTLQANYRHSFGGKEYFPAIHAFTSYIDKGLNVAESPEVVGPGNG